MFTGGGYFDATSTLDSKSLNQDNSEEASIGRYSDFFTGKK
jgi:hypothetical protein